MAESLLNTEAPVKNSEYSLCELDPKPPTACYVLFICIQSGFKTLKYPGKMTDVLRKLGARRADKIPIICANGEDIKKHFLPLLAGRCLVLRWEGDRISRLDRSPRRMGTGAGGGFLPGEGKLRGRRPSSRQGSGQRRGRLELTLLSGCVKSGLGFFFLTKMRKAWKVLKRESLFPPRFPWD